MKILFLIQSLQLAGSEKVAFELIKFLRGRGVDCCLVSLYRSRDALGRSRMLEELGRRGVEVVELDKDAAPRLGFYRTLRRLNAVVERFRPDVIHAHASVPNAYAGLRNLWFRKVRTVTTLHSGGDEWTSWKDRLLERLSIRGTDLIVSVAEHVAELYRGKFSRSRDKLVVIENGVDVGELAAIPAEEKRRLLAELGVAPGELVLTNVARIDPVKNQLFLVEVAERLSAMGLGFRLLLVGNWQDREYAEQLRRRIREGGLEGRVRLLGSRTDVGKLLRVSDVFLFPSRFEASPLALLEAICVGVPVVCSDIPANRRLTRSAANGRVLGWDAGAWANRIAELRLAGKGAAASGPAASGPAADGGRVWSFERTGQQYWALCYEGRAESVRGVDRTG